MSLHDPNANLQQELQATLLERRDEWEQRLGRIQGDRRRKNAPLEQDFEEQATQRQNDETLDALDARGREEVAAINAALERIAAGRFGSCVRCEEAIPPARLRAYPEAANCVSCTKA
jgi:DnaK suppressor protein